ncbi:DUF1289 domain-containing protein [bacterium]|nr:DUF1289 domain-containing protein [bacterium]
MQAVLVRAKSLYPPCRLKSVFGAPGNAHLRMQCIECKRKTPVAQQDSPCKSICKYNVQRYCIGCGRHMREAQYWYRLSPEEQEDVWQALPERLMAMDRGELGGFRRGPYET